MEILFSAKRLSNQIFPLFALQITEEKTWSWTNKKHEGKPLCGSWENNLTNLTQSIIIKVKIIWEVKYFILVRTWQWNFLQNRKLIYSQFRIVQMLFRAWKIQSTKTCCSLKALKSNIELYFIQESSFFLCDTNSAKKRNCFVFGFQDKETKSYCAMPCAKISNFNDNKQRGPKTSIRSFHFFW